MIRHSKALTAWMKNVAIVVLIAGVIAVSEAAAVVPSVLTFGWNEYGRTGLGTTSGLATVATPINTANLAGKTIVRSSGGDYHNLLLADDGSVFSFGSNEAGITGLGLDVGTTPIATPINTTNLAGKSISQLATGEWHSLLLAEDGVVFSFGLNNAGRTGLNTSLGNALVATPIDTTNLTGRTVTQVAAGRSHSLLLTDDGTVFSFGLNSQGQTGLGTATGSTLIATPINVMNLGGKTIKQIAAAGDQSFLLAEDGTVFSFGSNLAGVTGLGTSSGSTLIATPIDTTNLAGKIIAKVSAGSLQSLLLAEDGTVFSFGSNADGRTGLGHQIGNTLIATPIDTTNFVGKAITDVNSGGVHSLLLADDGSVFSFGSNGDGATGRGTSSGDTLIATLIDTMNLTGPRSRVIGIDTGVYHSVILAVPEPTTPSLIMVVALFSLRRIR
jgi:alpha-tubulin suppressor-like RCC1 family protein